MKIKIGALTEKFKDLMNLSKDKTENKEVASTTMTQWVNLTFWTKTYTLDQLVKGESIKLMKELSRVGIRMSRKEREEQDNKFLEDLAVEKSSMISSRLVNCIKYMEMTKLL